MESIVQGSTPVAAARIAGYKDPSSMARSLEKDERIRLAVEYTLRNQLHELEFTREDVLRGFYDAIRMASSAAEMIAGWREIAKIQGLYAPQRMEIDVTHREALARMSDSELAQAAAIDAEFVELDD